MQLLEEIWPRAKRSITIGSHQYQTINLGSYESSEMDGIDNKYLPGPYGGYLLKFHCGSANVFHIIRNDGRSHSHSAYSSAIADLPRSGKYATDARNAFWCNNGYVGILDYKGGVTIVTMTGEKVAYYPLDIEIERVACDYPFPDGIAFYTEDNANNYNFYVFTYSSKVSERICPSGKLVQPALAVAYHDGKGFAAFIDKTLGLINSQPENDEYVTYINKFEFLPHSLQLSPHGSLIACYDDNRLFVRSAKSTDFFPPFTLKDRIGDIAFLDESTISFIAKMEGDMTKVYTFQLEQKSTAQPVELFTNCKISHLIQDYESVRFYKSYYSDSDKMNYYELHIITPLSEKIETLLKKPYVDRIELLIQAKHDFDKEDIECYKILEELRGKNQAKKKYSNDDHDELIDLITVIIDAAPHILDISNSQSLLSLAAFGKYFATNFPHEIFADCIKKMRILYNLRKCESFVTVDSDFDNIEMTDFLSYIVQLEKYELAEQISRIFNLNRSIIAENWAISMFSKFRYQSDSDSIQCLNIIVDNVLSRFEGIDLLRVARMGIFYGVDVNIIRKIIGLIGDPQVRMNFILNNKSIFQNSDEAALSDLISSKDGNAIISYICIQRMTNNAGVKSLLKSPILQELYSIFKSQEYLPGKPLGYTYVMEVDNYPAIKKFQSELVFGYRKYDVGFGLEVEHLNAARNLIGPGIWGTNTQYQIKLIEQMSQMGWAPQRRPNGDDMWKPKPTGSARKAMELAVSNGNEAVFKYIANMYEVSKVTQCWIKLTVYARERKWNELQNWTKKSQALEWETFAEVCAENGNMELAIAYIERISNNDRKIDALISFKQYDKALAIAKSSKNTQKVNMIMQMMS